MVGVEVEEGERVVVGREGKGKGKGEGEGDRMRVTPHEVVLCALSLVYCNQNAQFVLRQAQSNVGVDMGGMGMEEDGFEDDQAAAEVVGRIEEVVEGLPKSQGKALAVGLPLSAGALDSLCDFVLRRITAAGAGRQGSRGGVGRSRRAGDLRVGLEEALGQDEGEEVARALEFFLQSIDTPDDLNMFFVQIHKLVWQDRNPQEGGAGNFQSSGGSRCAVEPHSLLGVFLRECCAAFELLSFEGVGRLLGRVRAFQGPQDHHDVPATPSPVAPPRREAADVARDTGALLRTFLLDVQRRDYYSALSSLHTYFDYSAGTHQGLAQVDTRLGNFEHATLEMAQLHMKFGHMREGIKALEETLRSSQQNTNHICLIHSLALMCQVLATPEYCFNQSKLASRIMASDAGFLYILNDSNRKHLNSLLYHCLQRARSLKLPHIEAFACAEMMKQKLLCSPNTAKASEELEKMGKLLDEILYVVNNESAETDCGSAALEDLGLEFNSKLSLYSDILGNREMLRAGPGSVKDLVKDLVTTLQLLQVTRWETKGCRDYAISLAQKVLPRPGHSNRDAALVLLTSYTLLQRGIGAAEETLEQSRRQDEEEGGALRLKSKHFRKAELLVEFHRCMFIGLYRGASEAAAKVALLCTANQMFDVAIFVEAQRLKFAALLEAGEHEGAKDAVDMAFQVAFKSGLRGQCLQCLLQYGRLYLATGNAQAALPYVLSAYWQSKSVEMDVTFYNSVYLLAHAWKLQGGSMVRRAIDLLRKHLSSIVSKCSLEVQGRAHLLLSRCLLLDGERSKQDALDHLGLASKAFATLGHRVLHREALYVTAHACQLYGMIQERDEASRHFRQLHEVAEHHPARTPSVVTVL
ncbi:subunit 5 of anaphase-promoting complex [Chloropicon primus]|nr:subunit 5 of anaphase-promoting complex [Chloropicon primus]